MVARSAVGFEFSLDNTFRRFGKASFPNLEIRTSKYRILRDLEYLRNAPFIDYFSIFQNREIEQAP
jgi:hypothetical protein